MLVLSSLFSFPALSLYLRNLSIFCLFSCSSLYFLFRLSFSALREYLSFPCSLVSLCIYFRLSLLQGISDYFAAGDGSFGDLFRVCPIAAATGLLGLAAFFHTAYRIFFSHFQFLSSSSTFSASFSVSLFIFIVFFLLFLVFFCLLSPLFIFCLLSPLIILSNSLLSALLPTFCLLRSLLPLLSHAPLGLPPFLSLFPVPFSPSCAYLAACAKASRTHIQRKAKEKSPPLIGEPIVAYGRPACKRARERDRGRGGEEGIPGKGEG